MFTAKDLEVYKDALKEKKNKATKTGEKPLKTPPSVAKISKAPLKLQNEEPIKERKPLSVVHKASNTIKDTHKPPSPHPVGTSKQTNPGFKPKEITSKSPSPGNIHPTEPSSRVNASDIKSETLKNPRETSLPKPPHIKPDDNKFAGLHKLKEPSTLGASHGVYQRSPSLSAVKVAPAVNVNASLCSECTRAASEGAVCFIGNDGRVSACTTRSAVRLCKNLNCAANNPEYVAAMANAPKKYLISKRHSLKAQFGLKSKSGRSKSPNLQQTGDARIDGWQQSSDALSPDMSPLNGTNIDTSLNNLVFESEDGELSPVNRSLRLLDGDMSLLDVNDAFCDGEMGLMIDVMGDMACREDLAAAEQGIAKHRDAINEFSLHEGEAGETESPKFVSLESSKEHVEALSESNGYDDANPRADAKSLELANSEKLDDGDAYGSPNLRASDADIPSMKDYEDTSLNVNGELVDGKAQMASMTGVSQVEDENQIGNVISTSDISPLSDDHQTGDKLKNNQVANDEQIGGVTSIVDVNQVTDDFMAVIDTSQQVHSDDKDGYLTPLKIGRVGDDGDSTSSIDTHVAHNNQSGGTENNKDDGQSRDNGDKKSLLIRHVADNGHGDDISMLNGEHARDDKLLLNDASSVIITSPNGGHIADDDQGDVTSLNGHGADDEQCDDLTSPNDGREADDGQCDDLTSPHGMHVMDGNIITDTQVADEGDNVLSPHSKHVADNEESVETPFPHDKQVLEDCLSHGFASPNGRRVAEDCLGHDFTAPNDRHAADGDESDEDDNEDGETDEIIKNICVTDDSSSIGLQKSLDSTEKSMGSGGEDGSVTSSSMKGNKQRRRRVLNVVEESNPETVTLRKQQTQERKQAEEWMINYAIEGVVHKLAPTGEAKVKILVEAFESIISHTDAEGIDTHNASKEKHTLA